MPTNKDTILLTDRELGVAAGWGEDTQGIDDYERDIAQAQLKKVCERLPVQKVLDIYFCENTDELQVAMNQLARKWASLKAELKGE
jgi:hypothetical protein